MTIKKQVKLLTIFLLGTLLWISITSGKQATAPPPLAPYLNGIFSPTAPGEVGSWEVEEVFPQLNIASPLRIIMFPNSEDFVILSKLGIVYRLDPTTQEQNIILDITDRSFKLGEAGTTGVVFHPEFGRGNREKDLIFIFYRHKPKPDEWDEIGYNRLSKFKWDEETSSFDRDSEEILFQQYDRSSWHNGGAMFFGPDRFLYLSLGDEGDEPNQSISTQRIDHGLFSGILRIDIDNDPERSHPIRRQPKSESSPPDGWPGTFSQGYSIPNDNPWQNTSGDVLEEFYAIGIRSPYSTYYDEMEDDIWVLDVGSDRREEINIVKRGDNLQWPYVEGRLESETHEKPNQLIGKEKRPLFDYGRSVGTAIIGGGIYRGSTFPSLFGNLILADFSFNKVMSLSFREGAAPVFKTLIPSTTNFNLDLPKESGISGVHIIPDGNIYLTIIDTKEHKNPGRILKLKQNISLPDPPSKLSELGIFSDMNTLEPAIDLIPYSVNSPLWSDRTIKRRWMALPNDGVVYDQIKFNNTKPWVFSEGTVFIKHFDLPITSDEDGPVKKVETRFFIMGKDNIGYGLTYKWNPEGTDAELLTIGEKETFDITENGEVIFSQTWDYPSRDQCLSCHNSNAGYVLGVNTHQLNGDQYYSHEGMGINQLTFLDSKNAFDQNISDPDDLHKTYPLDDSSVDLELRIRSYLDSNCSACHRSGGVPKLSMILTSATPLELCNIISVTPSSDPSNKSNYIVTPGDHTTSELWLRDSTDDDLKMPPLARNLVDEKYVALLAEWIDGLSKNFGLSKDYFLFPNPSQGFINLILKETWETPVETRVFSLQGELIYKKSWDNRNIYFEIDDYPAGNYILEIQSSNQRLVDKIVFI